MYRPLDWVLVRAPLLPVHALGEDRSADPRVRRALAVGAGELPAALARSAPDDRTAAKLQRYMIRMTSRPTPFGAFAGVALAGWGDHTDLELADKPAALRTRPDMGWLLDFVATLEQRADIRSQLRWFANPGAILHAGRVFLTEQTSIGADAKPGQAVSSRATGAVRKALEFARKPVPYRDLVAELADLPGATVEKVERLLNQLWEQTLLLTDLRPPLTGGEPARHVARRLAEIPAAADEAAALTELLDRLHEWDRLGAEESVAEHQKLSAKARELHSAKTPFQTDMAMPLAGRVVNKAVAAEAARAAELMTRLTPFPTGQAHWDSYREAFLARYGTDRDVPVAELLHPELGLGAPKHVAPQRDKARERVLTDLAVNAIRDRRLVIELDQPLIDKLQAKKIERMPISLDISLFVIAESPEAVDAGDFRVVVGPNMGALAAGRVLGRFADMLGPDAEDALRRAADAEDASEPGRIRAEVTYLPRECRLANVAVRPLVRDRELAFDTVASTDDVIPLDELVVGIRDDRLVLRWSATGQEVVPCAGHMLNPQAAAPAVLEFLDGLSRAGRADPMQFNWGPAGGFPFLPRVQAGRIVLSPARWLLSPADLDLFDEWRAHWQLPRHVYLAVADHRLLLDLDDPSHVEQLRIELRGKPADHELVLTEALPAPEHAWLPGADGRYISELVVPIVRDSVDRAAPRVRSVAVRADQRLRPLGSDWLFAKLYHLPTFEQDLLVDHVLPFCGEARDWFFMRYVDPEPHIRLRWRGRPDTLADELAPAVLRWANSLVRNGICTRVALDTYDREVERYGGPDGIALAEDLFVADSAAVLEILSLVDRKAVDLDTALLAVYTMDDLVRGLGLTDEQQDAFYRHAVVDRKESGKEYRTRQRVLRPMLGDPQWLAGQPGGDKIAEILAGRRRVVRDVAARYDALDTPVRSKIDLARSFVHMHANRLLGCGHPPEQRALGLLQRTRESLRHAPGYHCP